MVTGVTRGDGTEGGEEGERERAEGGEEEGEEGKLLLVNGIEGSIRGPCRPKKEGLGMPTSSKMNFRKSSKRWV